MEPQELLKTLLDELKGIAKTETVVGEPITIGSNTLIPVSRIMLGFGGGSGSGENAKESAKRSVGSGGGGGGGLKIEPAAFIVIKDEELKILAAPGKAGRLSGLFEAIPDIIEKFTQSKKGDEDDGEDSDES